MRIVRLAFTFALLVVVPVDLIARVIQTGSWGGPSAEVRIMGVTSEIYFPCARGTILERFATEPRGSFHLSGTYIQLHGGPFDPNEQFEVRPAHYVGDIHGNTMTLTV